MLYNKSRFKKVNDKKVLHKVRKRWVVISVALLGLLGAKSVVTHANANADTTNADNQQANHQLGNQSIKSAASIVPDKSSSLASGHVQASSNNAHSVSASSTTVDASSASSQHQDSVASSSVTITSASNNNVSSEAQQIHDHVLSEFANNNRIPQTNKGVHLLGGSNQNVPKNNDSIMGQLMNIMHNNIQSGANEAGAKSAYADLIGIISPDNLTHASNNAIDGGTWYSYLTRFQNDLTTINNNGISNPVINNILNNLNNLETHPISISLSKYFTLGPYTLKNDASDVVGDLPLYSLDALATRFDTPGGLAHKILKQAIPDESKLDRIGTVMHVLNNVANNSTLKQDYSKVVNDLNKLPNQSKADQVNTLHDLSNHISTFAGDMSTQGNGYLPSQDKQYFSGITSSFNKAHQAIGNEASSLQNQVTIINNINNELSQYNVGSLFNDAVNYAANHNDYTKLNSVANDAKADFANATNASAFINSFVGQIADLKNVDASTVRTELNGMKDNSAVSDAYNITKANSSAANNVLDNLASLNSANVTSNLDNVHNTISNNGSLEEINALNNVANSASTEATSVSESNAYKGLLNHESTLFSSVVNRINASGFNSNAFNTLVSNAKNDLTHAANVSDFANDLNGQDGAFDGTTAQEIKDDLTSFVNNPEFSNAYQAVHASSAAADNILDDLSGMNSNNEVAKLSDIANVAKSNFSNSASFGSLAIDGANMQTSVVNSQVASQQAASASVSTAINSLVSDFPVSATLSFVASKFASSGFNGASRFTALMNNAKADFDGADANNVNSFLDNLATQADQDFSAGDDQFINNAFNSMKSNSAINDAYSLLQNNKSAADDIFNDAAAMTTQNASSELNSIADKISSTQAFNNISAISNAANSARSAANSASTSASNRIASTSTANTDAASAEFSRLTSSEVIAPLFSAGIDRIVASGFNSGAFKTLISNVEGDLSNASNDSAFINDFVNQDSAFSGQTHRTVNSVMNQLANNSEMSSAYTIIRSNRGSVDQILNSLSGMNSSNEAATLSNVAQLAGNRTFNSVAFMGSLANDADVAATSVSNSQSISNQNVANQEAYSASSDASKAAGSAEQASTNAIQLINSNRNLASGYPSNSFSTAASNEIQDASTEAGSVSIDAANASNDAASASYYSALAAGQHPSTVKHGFGAEAPETNLQYAQQAQQANGDAQQANQDAQNALGEVRNDINNAQQNADKATADNPDVSVVAEMVKPVFDAITRPGFKAQQFGNAIQDVENHLNDSSLSKLWNDIKNDPEITAFTSRHGNTTDQVISDVTSNKGLQNAYQQVHSDSNLKTILSNLVTIANNHDDANGKSANQNNSQSIKGALNSIVSAINSDPKFNTIDGMTGNDGVTGKVSSVSLPSVEPSSSNSQATKANVQPIADMMPTIVNAITKPGFKASQFDGAIQAVEHHLGDTSLSQLWNDVKGNANVAAFTSRHGNMTKQITNLLNGNGSEIKELSQAYQQAHNDSKISTILNDLQTIANNHKNADGKSASKQTNTNVQNALKDIVNVINSDDTLKGIQGMQGNNSIAYNASNEAKDYKPAVEPPKKSSTVTPNVQSLDNMLQPILNRIVAKGFNSSAFQNAISAVQDNIKNANTLSDLWNAIQNNSGVQYFVSNHGNLTKSVINKLGDTNSPLEAAYESGHQDSAMTQILNDLSDISKHQQVGNNEVAQQSDVDDVNRDLSDINNQISQSNTLKSINGMTTLMNHVNYNNISIKKSSIKPDVSSVAPLISKALNRMTAANFDSRDFDNVITAIKNNISSAPSLSALWSDIDNNSSVKHFVGPVANEITSILDDGNSNQMKSLNAAYQQGHTKVGQILTDLQTIADNHLDANDVKAQNNKRDAIRQALTDVKSQLGNSALRSIKGVDQIASDVQNGINAKQYQDQDQPHYSTNETFNNLLKGLINPSLIKSLSDKLASADFAKSSDRSVFNQIVSDLKSLPNSSDPNSSLSDISKQLPKINNPLVKLLLPKFESVISQVKANDSTPEALAAYADSLPESKFIYGGLINDLNKGMQDVKNGKNNTDYKTVLSDLMNIDADVTAKHDSTDARATQEDRNLKAIANTVKNGGLKNIPFLNSFAGVARHVAAADSYNRKHAPIHTTDKNNHINHVNHVTHIKKQRADAQHWNNVARRDRLSANNAVAAATVDAQKAEKSAAAAQKFTSGLNSGSDSTSARNAARAASTDAAHASSEAARASTDAHKAMTDSVADNDSTIISDTNDARSIADQATKDANSTASEFKVAKTTAKKAGLAPHYADQTFNDTLGHLISGYTMQKLVDHLTSNNFAKSGERKAFNDVLTQLQKLPSQLSSQKNVNGTLDKISSDLNSFHGPISRGMAKKVQKLITDVEQHDDTPSTLVTYANADGADGKLINDLNAGMQTVKDGKDNQDYKGVLSDLIDLDTHPANQDHDLGEIAKTINHNHDLKTVPLLKNVSRTAHQMARSANHAQQNTDGQRHAKMINDENQHRKDVISHALISANRAASNAASIAARAVKSADAVQVNASGLNPGSDSTLASSYATNASADADQMKDVASQASSLAHVARANDRGSASVVLNNTKAADNLSSLVSDNANIVTTDARDASKAAQRAGKAPQPNVEVVTSVVPQILQRITAKGFDSSDFDKAVDAAKSDLSAETLTDFLSNFNKNASVKRFLGGNGTVTQAITKLLDRNGNLRSAYYDYHNDVNLPQILSDLEAIAAHQQIGDNLVAKDGDRTAVKNDLTDISRLVNDGRLNKIAGANDVLTAINSFNSNYKPSTKSAAKPSNVKPNLPITTNFVDHVLNRLTDSHFNKSAFASAITYGIEPALKSDSTLSDFINSIQSNSSVKSFMNSDGPVTREIMLLLTDTTSRRLLGASKAQNQSNKSSLPQQIKADLNAAYGVAHGDYSHVDGILNLLVDISKQPLDRQGKSDPIYNDLNAVAKDIDNDSSLKSVGGMPTVAYQARHDAPHYQVVPHYADQNFNQALSDLVNNYTVQQLADHLASKRFAQSGEKKAFNRIITDLEYLPISSNANLELSDIDSELNNFRGPLSKRVAAKVQSLIPQVEKHDSTPNALTVYANSLNNSDGNLINDLNKGFQDVKSGQNNLDYQAVLNDVMDIDQNPKQEDHDLNDIADTIRAHHLTNIPVLRDVADIARETAKSENSTRRHRDRPQQKKDAASQAAAKQKRAKDFAKRSAAKSAQSSTADQHAASRKATSLAHAKHMKARSTVASVSAAHAKARSARAVQSSIKSADSNAVSKASVAASNAFIADSSAKSAIDPINSATSNVDNNVKGLMSMHSQYKGDSSISDDAGEASGYAHDFDSDVNVARSAERQATSEFKSADSDYNSASSAADANDPTLADSYANNGVQAASQASSDASSATSVMNSADQDSAIVASLYDAASAGAKIHSANASASSAINSAKSSKASSAKSGSKSSSKASSNNDSSAIASANSRANSLASASAKAASSYVNAIKSAKAANDQSRANSLASASASASQSYSAALNAAKSAESVANSKASASVSAASTSASIAASIASSDESVMASSAESASSSAAKSSEAAHDAAVMSGIRASLASASQSASVAESIASASASRSASAEESAQAGQANSYSAMASSAEREIQSMTASIKSYAAALNSAKADHGSTNPNGSNGQNDSAAIASAEASAANAENAASANASLSASISASEAIASQEAVNSMNNMNNQSRNSSGISGNGTNGGVTNQSSQPSNVTDPVNSGNQANSSDRNLDNNGPESKGTDPRTNQANKSKQDPSKSSDSSDSATADPLADLKKRVNNQAADPVSHQSGKSDPVSSEGDPVTDEGSSKGLDIGALGSNDGANGSSSNSLPQTGEASSEAKLIAAALLSLSAMLLSVGFDLDLKHRN